MSKIVKIKKKQEENFSFIKNKLLKISTSIVFEICIIGIIFIILFFLSIKHITPTQIHLKKEAEKVNATLVNVLNETYHLLYEIGEKFIKENPQTDEKIAAFLHKYSKPLTIEDNYQHYDLFVLKYFSWIGPDYIIYLNPQEPSKYLKLPYNNSNARFVSMSRKCTELPWVMHLPPSYIGLASGVRIVPAALGMTLNAKHMGAIGAGLNPSVLAKKIQRSLDDKFYFLVIDSDQSLALQPNTIDYSLDETSFHYQNLLKEVGNLSGKEGELPYPIHYKDIIYSYYKKMDSYDYLILIGFDKTQARKDFLTNLFPLIYWYLSSLIICCILIYIYRQRIKHLVQLSKLNH